MNPPLRFVFRLLSVLLLASGLLAAAPGRLLRSGFSDNGKALVVDVPAGCRAVRVQQFVPGQGWTTRETLRSPKDEVRIRLPAKARDGRWRAIGIMRVREPSQDKFPAGFYRGKNRFGAVKDAGISPLTIRDAGEGGGASETPVEADLWEIDGDTIYYFNQFRGLQVLDLSDPADPRLRATLALPAAGEKLYLLPGDGPARHLVLVAQGEGGNTKLLVVRVEGNAARVVQREVVDGWYEDSRLIGDRLVLVTSEWNERRPLVRVDEWRIATDAAPQRLARRNIPGTSPVVSAGAGWLAVATCPPDEWDRSEVRVFSLATPGLGDLTPLPVELSGHVSDSFKMRWADNVLTTISERSWRGGEWNPVTVLETFRVWGPDVVRAAVVEEAPRLGRLMLAEGESLYATRFDGDRAYVVTFLQKDPLWIVDLANPRDPRVAGHLEVPGWSTHLEPLGDMLFSIGWDDGTVVASLFDVADSAAPTLIRRLPLGPAGTYSEAAWDEMALSVLPDAGLALVPLASSDATGGSPRSWVQLIDFDAARKSLGLRGEIRHAFEPRRAGMVGGAIASISQRVLVTADARDRDAPRILAEVSLAWPVDRAFEARGFLIQIEDGNSYDGGTPTARVSASETPDAILEETGLGSGVVRCAETRGGKLYVLRDTRTDRFFGTAQETNGSFVLDIYDLATLPALVKLGSCRVPAPADRDVPGGRFHWPRPDLVAVIADSGPLFWLAASGTPRAKAADRLPFWRPTRTPMLTTFDVSDPAEPRAGGWTRIGNDGTAPTGVVEAGDGLLAIAATDRENEKTGKPLAEGEVVHTLRIVETRGIGEPVVGMAIDLPGEAVAVTSLDRGGCLIFSRTFAEGAQLTALACDGSDAYQLGSAPIPDHAPVAAVGRLAFVAEGRRLRCWKLANNGDLEDAGEVETGTKVYELRCQRGLVIGTGGDKVFAVSTDMRDLETWSLPTWIPDSSRIEAMDGGLWVPLGHYGVRSLER